jgi:hypothetical protein
MQQQPKRSTIKRPLFLEMSRAIKDQLRLGVYNPERIAKGFNVSTETIRNVRAAGTWPQFERDKAERRKRALSRRPLNAHGLQTVPPITIARPEPTKRSLFSRLLRMKG